MSESSASKDPVVADVCLVLEGTYPYVEGGVSSWTHELINRQSHLTFHLVCLLPKDADLHGCIVEWFSPYIKFNLKDK